ncbi:hypothetical protein EVAR_51815_1 [Eumeta japonica]|uniref:Uncharacterized protein n=1 Tax=Eumeta variegata TaxID=151549 RepID=A0A4C1XW03_EUMVA|nr:hypothetical protein EVAR_51815_1 [Eumeta japonica]
MIDDVRKGKMKKSKKNAKKRQKLAKTATGHSKERYNTYFVITKTTALGSDFKPPALAECWSRRCSRQLPHRCRTTLGIKVFSEAHGAISST